MNPTGNREPGDRNLSTADLAAAGRKPPQAAEPDDELDTPRAAARDADIDEHGGAPGSVSPGATRGAAMSDRAAADRRSDPPSSAAERRGAATTSRSASDKPATDRGAEQLEPLFPPEVASDYRGRWAAVQSSFVDDPRRAVREGDELVAQMMKNLAESFASERGRLETQLGRAGDTTTETLRVSLRRYRSFFERLLSL